MEFHHDRIKQFDQCDHDVIKDYRHTWAVAVPGACLDKSKSVSMTCPVSCNKMFSGFRSLYMNPFMWRYSSANRTECLYQKMNGRRWRTFCGVEANVVLFKTFSSLFLKHAEKLSSWTMNQIIVSELSMWKKWSHQHSTPWRNIDVIDSGKTSVKSRWRDGQR